MPGAPLPLHQPNPSAEPFGRIDRPNSMPRAPAFIHPSRHRAGTQ